MRRVIASLLKRASPDLTSALRLARAARARRNAAFVRTDDGFLFACDPGVGMAFEDPGESAVLRGALRECDVFVDVGANVGFQTCLALQHGKRVVAIEPLAQNLDYLYANLQANGWDDVEVFPLGLADRPAIATLHGRGALASLVDGWAHLHDPWTRPIPLSTLDVLLRGRFTRERLLIKVDVEGAEAAVLAGAEETLSRAAATVWMMEVCLDEHHPDGVNPDFVRVFDVFWRHGYRARTVDGGGTRPVERADVERWAARRSRDFGSANYVFARAPREVAP